ncbi:hydrogenase nickel incorporation protein HypB [Campylobacter geochelonis]|uniref:Hydrogenase accessory protein HypB n=1 Tax=Campylobacter geochelonis TaxID=1780362 RepID=A0A128EIH0_9BACT|nr:hydrogenase nickel incorporation protein HypB [Campylobacter geochelonis]QKF71278.1 hydrogenase nickel insertion protein HypB [Campylobacter geochelonis]CZE48128.1 hydrogenase accessory protein HypB [Campylobacter geochelonis]CZE49018.1 hydrogenase accessory protein HypB [Campylobacter geochelonis]CZE51103.1 hydrogenase accessory protein HypB [Campylobacter geochelonis]
MCKDCGCSIKGHTHSHQHSDDKTHAHTHTHADGTTHTHSHEHANESCNHESSSHEHTHENEHAHPALNESKTIEVITKILSQNDKEAQHNRAHLDENGILCINLMSSPGSGKTTLLEATIKADKFKIGVVEGDLETNKDADRIVQAGAPAHQITTGQACHLDAFMVHEGLHHLPLEKLDIVFIENVGNLVCPASYDVGSHLNIVLLSVPEGSDKVAKYPVMFRAADLIVITKTSLLPHFDFSVEDVIKEARKLNPKVDVIALDSKTGEGVEKWFKYLEFKKELR